LHHILTYLFFTGDTAKLCFFISYIHIVNLLGIYLYILLFCFICVLFTNFFFHPSLSIYASICLLMFFGIVPQLLSCMRKHTFHPLFKGSGLAKLNVLKVFESLVIKQLIVDSSNWNKLPNQLDLREVVSLNKFIFSLEAKTGLTCDE